jgi:hypothetical protein
MVTSALAPHGLAGGGGGGGLSVAFAVTGYIGLEAAAVFSEESARLAPHRRPPYLSLALMTQTKGGAGASSRGPLPFVSVRLVGLGDVGRDLYATGLCGAANCRSRPSPRIWAVAWSSTPARWCSSARSPARP